MKIWQKINFYFLIILFIFIPLQGLITNLLIQKTGINLSIIFWLMHWYEPFLFILLLFGLYNILRKKYFTKMQLITLIFIFIGCLSIIFFSQSLTLGLEASRYTLLGAVVFFIFTFIKLESSKISKLVNLYIFIALILAIFSILERFLPVNYWNTWMGITEFGYGIFYTGEYVQSTSLMVGPNQLSSYLIPAIIFLFINKDKKLFLNKFMMYILLLILISSVFLAQTRSVILALGIVTLLYWYKTSTWKIVYKIIISLLIIVGIILLIYVYAKDPILGQLITHGGQTGHQDSFVNFMTEITKYSIREFSIGHGVGSSGPLVLKTGIGIIPESWYLQLVYEIGILGLISWLGFMYYLIKNLFIYKLDWLAWSFISLSIVNIFLHTWADNPAITIIVFIIAGLYISNKPVVEIKNKG